jgi:chromosome segregation ATPase
MSNELTTLSTLAVEIDALNEQANIYANQAVIYAAKSGQKLLLAKSQCNHGEFKTWLDEHCKLSYSTAKRYMQLATTKPELLSESNGATSRLMPSISQMIELLSADEKVNETVTAKIEAGEDVTIKEIQRLKREAAEAVAAKDTIQFALTEKQARLDWLEMDKKAIHEQNDQLRNTLAFEVDKRASEKLELERAKLILENQDAIAQAKREAENAKAEIERLKKERDNQIKLGVARELQSLDYDIKHKEGVAKVIEGRIKALRDVEMSLEREVGYLQTHKKAIEKIKDNLSFLAVSFSDAFETETIPTETVSDWTAIYDALNKLVTQMREWRENNTLIGELVD